MLLFHSDVTYYNHALLIVLCTQFFSHLGNGQNPTESEYLTGGGIYIINDTVPCGGRVNSLNYCGRLNSKGKPASGPPVEYIFTLLHLKRSSIGFDVHNREDVIYSNDSGIDNEGTSTNVTCHSHTLSDPFRVRKGDQFAVIIGAQCYQGYCPIQVAVVDSGCENASLFEPNYYDYYKPSIGIINTSLVAVRVDVRVKVGEQFITKSTLV